MIRKDPGGFGIKKSVLIWVVVGLALALRILHLFFTTRYNPLAQDLTLDAAIYDRWAKGLTFGGSPGPTRLMQAPLYPWLLSAIYRLFGPKLTAVRLIQALIGTASCALVVTVTKRLFRSYSASVIAGTAAALYLPSIFYEGILVPATVILFLNLLFITILSTGSRPRGIGRPIIAGIVLGLSATAKPVALLIFPFALLHLFFSRRENGRAPPSRGAAARPESRSSAFAKQASALTAGLIISLTPLIIRNARLAGEFIPLTTGGGINFYIGNNPRANGYYAVPSFEGKSLGATPEEQQRRMYEIASRKTGKTLSPSEISGFWLKEGFRHNLENPGQCGRLLWRKFLFFWNGYERANVENLSFSRRFPGVLRLPLITFGFLAPIGLIGIFLTRNRWRELWLLYGGIFAYLTAALIFYVLARYRLPVVVFLMPFAGAAVPELFEIARGRRKSETVLVAAALALLFYFTNMTVAKDTTQGISNNLTRLGDAWIARGDTTSAIKAYSEALDQNAENRKARKSLERLRRIRM